MTARRAGAITFVRPASNQLFFVYTGRARGVGVNPIDFFAQTRLLERNVVVLQDRHRAFYHRGVSAAVPSFDALLGWLTAFRDSLPHVRRVFCLGTSVGGYAALLSGHLLGVEQVWAFGPPTVLPDVPSLRGVSVAVERRDLAVALASDNGRTKCEIYYNGHDEADGAAAARIAGCPRVTLWSQPGHDHNVVKTLLETSRLAAVLPEVS